MIINAAKRSTTPQNAPNVGFETLFNRIDESRCTVLELAVKGNHAHLVQLVLREDPAYQHGRQSKRNGLMRLIYKAIDEEYKDIVKLLSETYEAGINPDHNGVVALILAIKRRDKGIMYRLIYVLQ